MKEFTVVLGSINDVKNFVNVVTKYDYEIDLTSGRYVVDAKSIMGIFSLDLTKPIKVRRGLYEPAGRAGSVYPEIDIGA